MHYRISLGNSLIKLALAICMIFSIMVVPANATETITTTIDEVPLYFQTDYPDVPYGNGTVKTSGCGITCLSMIASYMTDKEILPDELAKEFGSRRDSNLGRMEYASETLGLTYEKEFDWKTLIQALEDGKVAIALVNDTTRFTGSQHFIVLTGVTDDGKVMVNDPNGRNYERLKRGFEEGFKQSSIECGFQGAWIYDKQTMSTQVDEP